MKVLEGGKSTSTTVGVGDIGRVTLISGERRTRSKEANNSDSTVRGNKLVLPLIKDSAKVRLSAIAAFSHSA